MTQQNIITLCFANCPIAKSWGTAASLWRPAKVDLLWTIYYYKKILPNQEMLVKGLSHTDRAEYMNQYALVWLDINQYVMQESYMLYTS